MLSWQHFCCRKNNTQIAIELIISYSRITTFARHGRRLRHGVELSSVRILLLISCELQEEIKIK